MDILILHNNNLPSDIVDLSFQENDKYKFFSEVINRSPTDDESFDEFITHKITDIFSTRVYDLILLPYSMCNDNYANYLGIRLGMHLRFTEKTETIPLLFLGIDSKEEIARLTELGSLLFTPKVFTSTVASASALIDYLDNLSSMNVLCPMTYEDYMSFMKRVVISELDNYGPHSLANVWAIKRWNEMLFKGELDTTVESDFKYLLNFKYIDKKAQLLEKRQSFKKKHAYSPRIEGIKGKTILYIDDEYDKGWETILRNIFELSGAEFLCYTDFDKGLERETLIKNICSYIDTVDVDCFIIDLRLHEDDFIQKSDLSGHIIAKHIKEKNIGNQIVVFTASNKIWNLKEELFTIGAVGYALKESPDLILKREDSLALYKDFVKSIRLACAMSYLKDLVVKQERLKQISETVSQLDSVVHFLALDRNQENADLLSGALLSEIVFIEDFIKEQLKFVLSDFGKSEMRKLRLVRQEETIELTGHMFFKREEVKGRSCVVEVSSYYLDKQPVPEGWCDVLNSDVTLVAGTLLAYYHFSVEAVQLYIKLKNIRNTQVAHGGRQDIKIGVQMLLNFYNDVISVLVERSQESVILK